MLCVVLVLIQRKNVCSHSKAMLKVNSGVLMKKLLKGAECDLWRPQGLTGSDRGRETADAAAAHRRAEPLRRRRKHDGPEEAAAHRSAPDRYTPL